MNVNDFLKYVELVYPQQKQDLIKKSIVDFNLFLEQFKEDIIEDEEEEEEEDAIIYKIFCKDPTITECYVGLTKKSIEERWYHHKKTCENENYKYYNKHLYQFIRQTKGITNWDIVLLEKIRCKNNFEARAKEQYYIDTENATLNKIRAQKI